MTDDALAAEILGYIPASVRDLSGGVLYSGRDAWTGTSPVYLLGINPGGNPDGQAEPTVAEQAAWVLSAPSSFSAYRDEAWATPGGRLRAPGTAPLQRSVLHLLKVLGLDPGTVPASNIVYVRSRQAKDIEADTMRTWAEECWPFHAAMIERLGVRIVVCFGGDVAGFVRSKVGAHTEADCAVETNARGWTSRLFTGPGVWVVAATHPARANWANPESDVSPLVVRALAAHRETT